ncbi:hypothetical protein NQZ68_017167 [Dissostichus eleginoides]|nr:hypothetical protein NQZ68_017167 [Dissostichus eleginoides]
MSFLCAGRRFLSSDLESPSVSESIGGIMVSRRILLLSASCWLLVAFGNSDERSPEDVIITREEGELIEALQEVLERLKNKQLPSSERKLSWLPACDAGEQCAVRKGARIGKLCGCPGGTVCDYIVLKCL